MTRADFSVKLLEYILLSTGSQGGKGFVQAIQESPARYPFCLGSLLKSMDDSHACCFL